MADVTVVLEQGAADRPFPRWVSGRWVPYCDACFIRSDAHEHVTTDRCVLTRAFVDYDRTTSGGDDDG